MSKSVFLSHAVKDKELASELVTLIEEGIGVPDAEIFCSSLDGYSIPNGKNFVTYIKEQITAPKIVVLLLTPAYFESKFCLAELGAAWIMPHDIFPILVPPLDYSDVKDVLLGTQVTKIDDDIKYNQLRDRLAQVVTLNDKSPTKWDTKRRAFLKNIAPLVADIAGPSMVSTQMLEELQVKLAEALVSLDANEQEITTLKMQLANAERRLKAPRPMKKMTWSKNKPPSGGR